MLPTADNLSVFFGGKLHVRFLKVYSEGLRSEVELRMQMLGHKGSLQIFARWDMQISFTFLEAKFIA